MKSTGSVTLALSDLQWLQRFAAMLARDADDADDLVQETLVAVWANPPQDAERTARPWLATVLRNLFRMQRRAGARRELREQIGSSVSETRAEPERELARLEVLRILLAELEQLAPEDQRIIIKRFFEGESAAEIGRLLKIPAATVRSRLHRSLQRLRGALDQQFKNDRSAWSAAVLISTGPPLVVSPSPELLKEGSEMSLTVKAIAVATLGTLGVACWFAVPEPPKPASEASPELRAAVTSPPPPKTPKAAWEQRRSSIRQVLPAMVAASPAPQDDGAAEQRAHDDLGVLRRACLEDLGNNASGAVTLAVTKIGAPDVGTIYDKVELIETTFEDKEVLECLIQSMYGWVGEAPVEPFERRSMSTFMLGEPKGEVKEQRIFEAIIGAHIGEVRWCETRGKPDALAVNGQASLAFTLEDDANGMAKPRAPIVLASDLPQEVVDCMINASPRWKFPATMRGKTFEYHFVLPVPGVPLPLRAPSPGDSG